VHVVKKSSMPHGECMLYAWKRFRYGVKPSQVRLVRQCLRELRFNRCSTLAEPV
jgi:hypothetical protein